MIQLQPGRPVLWSELQRALLAMLRAGASIDNVTQLLTLCVDRFGVEDDTDESRKVHRGSHG